MPAGTTRLGRSKSSSLRSLIKVEITGSLAQSGELLNALRGNLATCRRLFVGFIWGRALCVSDRKAGAGCLANPYYDHSPRGQLPLGATAPSVLTGSASNRLPANEAAERWLKTSPGRSGRMDSHSSGLQTAGRPSGGSRRSARRPVLLGEPALDEVRAVGLGGGEPEGLRSVRAPGRG